jgi:hypothetical protein
MAMREACVSLTLGVALAGGWSSHASAAWTITTYKRVSGSPPINTLQLADEYFTGAHASRFEGERIVPYVD